MRTDVMKLKILVVRFCHLKFLKYLLKHHGVFYQLIADNLNWVLSLGVTSICITLRYQKIRTRRAKLNLKRRYLNSKNENKKVIMS